MSLFIADVTGECEGGDEDVEIPMPLLDTYHLDKVIQYCGRHVDDPAMTVNHPLPHADMVELVGPWDAEFIAMSVPALFRMMGAASYANIPSLLDLCIVKVASLVMTRTPEGIRAGFGTTKLSDAERARALANWKGRLDA